MDDFIMTVRAQEPNGTYGGDVADDAAFLSVPQGANDFNSGNVVTDTKKWYDDVVDASKWQNQRGEPRGDIVILIHGYNMSTAEVLQRHQLVRRDLEALAFKGVIVSFDWPAQNQAISYWEDRHSAKLTAFKLVDKGIKELSARQTPTCPVNVHLICHSTGAYVLREAFEDAEDSALPDACWTVSQIVFIAGDVSAISMSGSDGIAEATYRHCTRLTNYSNRWDEALGISNVKRIGVAPRVGRIGLPDGAPNKAVNVDCGDYYNILANDKTIQGTDSPTGLVGFKSHSWFFGNKIWARDLFQTLIGTDRVLPGTRRELIPPLTSRFVLQRDVPAPASVVQTPTAGQPRTNP